MKHFGCDVSEERVQACGAKRMGKVGPRRNHKEFTRGVSPTVAGQRTCTGFVYRTTKFCPLPRIVTRKGRACGAFTFPPTVPLKKKTELLCMPADRSPRSKIQQPPRSILLTQNDKTDSSSPLNNISTPTSNLDCFSMIPFQITISLLLSSRLCWAQISGDSTFHVVFVYHTKSGCS